jgi:hypothetical protein
MRTLIFQLRHRHGPNPHSFSYHFPEDGLQSQKKQFLIRPAHSLLKLQPIPIVKLDCLVPVRGRVSWQMQAPAEEAS